MRVHSIILCLALVTAVLAQCGGSLQSCAGACYNPSQYSCPTDSSGKSVLCPVNMQACNGGCYDPTIYNCNNGALAQGAAKKPASTTGAKISSSTTVAARPASSTTAAKISSSTTPATSAASVNCNTMFNSLVCRTTSQSVSQVDAGGVTSSRNWLCGTYPQFCTDINGSGKYGVCNSVEQLSYAMNLYYLNFQSQGASACNFGGIAKLVSTSTPATTASPVVNPTPSPYPQFPAQNADLRIINNCKSALWFEARYGNQGAPLPGQSATSVQALPGSYVDYTIPDTGLSGTRFWAKYGCDNNGKNCKIGDQMQYWPNPPGGCPAGGCTPPVDSLFEATWGCRPGSSCNAQNPTTWFDTSQVDGWTIPYKLTPVGDTSGCDCIGSSCGFKGVDASTLDVAKCPSGEDLSAGGSFSSVQTNGKTVPLNSVDLRIIKDGEILGCMSPCKRLNWGFPFGLQQDESSGSALWMCCPTPTPQNCNPANGCVTPQQCRSGPIENTQFVAAVHNMAPGVYSYSYDDGVGLHACPAGVTKYTMEFCPSGSAAYPGTA